MRKSINMSIESWDSRYGYCVTNNETYAAWFRELSNASDHLAKETERGRVSLNVYAAAELPVKMSETPAFNLKVDGLEESRVL